MRTIDTAPLPLSDLSERISDEAYARVVATLKEGCTRAASRQIFTISPSRADAPGVSEAIGPLVGYALGAGAPVLRYVIDAPEDFRALSTRLTAFLHGSRGDRKNLKDKDRDLYEHVLASNAENIIDQVHEGDIVILHEPACAGLTQAMKRAGAYVVWRFHGGTDDPNEYSQMAWAFLEHYLEDADALVFSRPSYRPSFIEEERCRFVAPSIYPESPKNRVLDLDECHSVVRLAGVVQGKPPFDAVAFVRSDGRADAIRTMKSVMLAGGPLPEGSRLVTQVSRWDELKDMLGVAKAFSEHLTLFPNDVHLLLIGPALNEEEGDRHSDTVAREVIEFVENLPKNVADRIHVAGVPMSDREVNALIVNAVQRISTVITQKSLVEGFGLTVAEAMWKKRPVVASAVGGILDQIEDGVTGVLVSPPEDGRVWAESVAEVLTLPQRADDMGLAAHEYVRENYLPDRHLCDVVDVLSSLFDER
ncbi:glycosyltransferase [Actinomyces vulturis]|uniref:glycosyltransferase n=1 Tax=Actinomyces vulturis TaxID=1857645 RepID=UPI00082E9DA0|nr:glycosyltransferase [Actinomyces vulturis]